MTPKTIYRVVGIRPAGERVIICQQSTLEVAEKVVNLIQVGSLFDHFIIESDGDGIPPRIFKPPG